MISSIAATLPTRLVDLSGVRLSDLERCDSHEIVRLCATVVVREVSEPPAVALAGSNS